MMGATHGVGGLAVGAATVLTARELGVDLDGAQAAIVIACGAVAAELPDLDLRTSRISHGTSSLTGVPFVGRLALLLTLPVVLAGAAIRSTGVSHRGPTHSVAAALAWTAAIVPLYALYWWLLGALLRFVAAQTPLLASLSLADTSVLQHAWFGVAPVVAIATLTAYLSHLLLDDMTPAKQSLLWPLRTEKISVLRRPQVPVGGAREFLLVALPLGLLALSLGWQAAGPFLPAPGDLYDQSALQQLVKQSERGADAAAR